MKDRGILRVGVCLYCVGIAKDTILSLAVFKHYHGDLYFF